MGWAPVSEFFFYYGSKFKVKNKKTCFFLLAGAGGRGGVRYWVGELEEVNFFYYESKF